MNTTPNGRTMRNLLQGIPAEDLISFNVLGTPDVGSCASAYKISNSDAKKSALTFTERGGVLTNIEQTANTNFAADGTHGGNKHAKKYLMRELVWKLSSLHRKRFKKWLKDQAPECIIFMYSDAPFMLNLTTWISKLLNIPMIVYSCENYCFKEYNYLGGGDKSLAYKMHHKKLLKATKKLFERADALICNSDELGEEFKRDYRVLNYRTVTMSSTMEYFKNVEVRPISESKVVYCGALGMNRINAIIDIAESLASIDPTLKLDVYGRVTIPEVQERITSCKAIRYNGLVPYSEVKNITQNAALNIELINNDPITARNKKYGLSTKFADALACGTPFLIYAPAEMVETQITKRFECAFIATDKNQLKDQLYKALTDAEAREVQVANARKATDALFNEKTNLKNVAELLEIVSNKK